MVGWHHQLNGHEFEQAPGVGDGQGSLVCCSPWGHKESDTTEGLNEDTEEKRHESDHLRTPGTGVGAQQAGGRRPSIPVHGGTGDEEQGRKHLLQGSWSGSH